jgi:hypothetical protein
MTIMAKLGGAYIPNMGSSFGGAVTPRVSHYRETPSAPIDLTHGDLGGFTVAKDPKWGNDTYGVVAVSKEAFSKLPEELRAHRMSDARDLAEKLNNPQAQSAITVKAATNQSRKSRISY